MSLVEYQPSEIERQRAQWKAARARIAAAAIVKPVQIKIVKKSVEKVAELVAPAIQQRDWLHVATPVGPTIGEIVKDVCKQFGISKNDFESARRNQDLAIPRQVAMALARHLTKRSLPEIGRHIANRDHTTVLHSCRKWEPVLTACCRYLPDGAPVSVWVQRFKAEMEITGPEKLTKYRKKIESDQTWAS